jgi:hypothetical protein
MIAAANIFFYAQFINYIFKESFHLCKQADINAKAAMVQMICK